MSVRPVNYCDYERNDLLAGRAMWQREYKVLDVIRRRMPENMQAAILDVGCRLEPSRLVSAAATLKKEFLTMTLVSTSCIQEK